MVEKILGLIDLFVLFILFFAILDFKFHLLITLAVVLLLLKSVPFLFLNLCLGSLIDLLTALTLIFLNFFTLPLWLTLFIFFLLAQKAFFSFF